MSEPVKHRVEKGRKSAKGTITSFAEELLNRDRTPENKIKLITIESIALRMGWNELYNKLRFRSGLHSPDYGHAYDREVRKPWVPYADD